MSAAVSPFRLRLMTIADIPCVAEIERTSFPLSWPPTAYQRELERGDLARYTVAVERISAATAPSTAGGGRLARLLASRHRQRAGAPAASNERIMGFLGLWFIVDEAHIVTVAVREDSRRRGLGELLVAEAIDAAAERLATLLTLEVRVSNTGAQALYQKYGFARVGIRKRYYTDNGEDALIMTTPSLTDPAYRELLDQLRRERPAPYPSDT